MHTFRVFFMIKTLHLSRYFQNNFNSRCFQTHVLLGSRMRTIYFTLKSQMNLPKPLSAFLKVNLEQKKDDNGLEQKTDENKNSMTNLQHFVWLLQYRLAILTSHKTLKTNRLNIVFQWLFRIFREILYLLCFAFKSTRIKKTYIWLEKLPLWIIFGKRPLILEFLCLILHFSSWKLEKLFWCIVLNFVIKISVLSHQIIWNSVSWWSWYFIA